MKKIIVALALLFVFNANAENMYKMKLIRVVDGDTILFHAGWLPVELKPQIAIRVKGVDTPEKAPFAKCKAEVELSNKATEYVKNLVATSKDISVVIHDWDKYGGRLLGDVFVDDRNLSQLLVSNGFGRLYNGGTKKSWCE